MQNLYPSYPKEKVNELGLDFSGLEERVLAVYGVTNVQELNEHLTARTLYDAARPYEKGEE